MGEDNPDAGAAVIPNSGVRSFALARALPPDLLSRHVDPAALSFALCSGLEEAPGLIGQERAIEAIEFAMRMRKKGYNAYALGASGTGRHSVIEALLGERAAAEPTPPDWVLCQLNRSGSETARRVVAGDCPPHGNSRSLTRCATVRHRR